jgi:hypothetical protein
MDGSHLTPQDRLDAAASALHTVRAPRTARGTRRGHLLSALAGFVAGAICWHMVGFWGFVTEAVLPKRTDPRDVPTIGRTFLAASKTQNRSSGPAGPLIAQSGNCTTAISDRTGGEARVVECGALPGKFRAPRFAQRSDRGDFGPTPVPVLIGGTTGGTGAVGGWSARVEDVGSSLKPE